MKNKCLKLLLIGLLLTNTANASFKEHYDLGQEYFSNYQYSAAITEFKNALRINYLDNSARIGLINAYLASATYSANEEQNYKKAADYYRSALFYMVYYPQKATGQYVSQVTDNLNACLDHINFSTSAKNRFNTAKTLRAEGNFAAAAYEFGHAATDKNYQKESFEQIGDIMKLLGNIPKAAEYYRKAVSVAPDDLKLRMTYGQMLDRLDQENAAINEYNFVLSKVQSNNTEILYSLERIFKKKLTLVANNADLLANLAAILQKQGKYDEALTYYQQSEYYNPANINTRINVGTLYQQKGDYKTAIKAYETVLIVEPDNIKALLYRAQSKMALGDSKEALEGYRKVIAIDPSNTEAQGQIIDALKNTMTVEQFAEYLKKNMPELNPNEIFYNYALDLHKQNKFNDAITLYNEVIKANTNNYEVYVNLAIAQNQLGEQNAALSTLNDAEIKFPNNKEIKTAIKNIKSDMINAKLNKAADFYNNNEYKKAIEEYLSIVPETVDSCLGIASSYQGLKNNKKAIEYYKKALQLKPTDSEIAYYIGALSNEEGDLVNAKSYLNKSLIINKNNQNAKELLNAIVEQENVNKLNQAIAFYDSEKYDNALPLLNELITADNKNSYAYYYRGMIYDAKNNKINAINDLKKAYELNNEFEIVNYLIAIDYDALEKYKEACAYYTKFINSYSNDDDYKKYSQTRLEELKNYVK